MSYYADLLNLGVDVDDVEDVGREYLPGDELVLRVMALMIASIKEKLAAVR